MQFTILLIIFWIGSIIGVFYVAQFLERKRIGSKIHNELANDLLVKAIWFKKKIKKDSSPEMISSLLNDIELMGITIRQWSHDLYHNKKDIQTDYHLLIRKLVNNLVKPLEDCSVSINYQWKMEEIVHSKKETQFIINFINENLVNSIKYASANNIVIDFWDEDEFLFLQIEDNGIGFDVNSESKGIGKKSLVLDAKKINATIVYESGIGDGTTIRAKIKKKK